ATDIASFLVRNGMPTVQLNGVPTRDIPLTSEAVVISLKTRSCPAGHCCKVSDEAAFCLIQRPYISKTLL
ncbi:hypothetical protein NXG64_29625, partial [Klebsiella pneumoniae]|nr:hypothetical protein [Klebsiella pneumoniae]MDS7443285.1 hypothetical protein [Klebsiella pneumoniae]